MDSDEGYNYEFDEDEECSEDSGAEEDEEDEEEDEPDDNLDLGEVELVEPVRVGGERDGLLGSETGGLGPGGGGGGLGGGPGPGGGPEQEEDYRYEVLTAEQILQHMVECIREVNEVIQVRPLGAGTGGDTRGKGRGGRRDGPAASGGTGPGPSWGQRLTDTARSPRGRTGLLGTPGAGGGSALYPPPLAGRGAGPLWVHPGVEGAPRHPDLPGGLSGPAGISLPAVEASGTRPLALKGLLFLCVVASWGL